MYEGEPPAVFEEWRPRARKPHKCCECRGVIRRGNRYRKAKGLWDGEWSEYKTHEACYRLALARVGGMWCNYAFGDLEILADSLDEFRARWTKLRDAMRTIPDNSLDLTRRTVQG